jgi:antitoxin CptB
MHEDSTRAQAAPGAPEARIKRLRFRAWRRGFKEADLVLGRFADLHATSLDVDDLARFEALLEENDADVYGWVTGTDAPPARHDHALLARLKAFAQTLDDLGLEPSP